MFSPEHSFLHFAIYGQGKSYGTEPLEYQSKRPRGPFPSWRSSTHWLWPEVPPHVAALHPELACVVNPCRSRSSTHPLAIIISHLLRSPVGARPGPTGYQSNRSSRIAGML